MSSPVAVIHNIGLVESDRFAGRSVDGDSGVADMHHLTRKSHYSLDKKLGRVFRVAENNNIAALRALQVVRELVNNEILPVLKRRHHGSAGDDEGLRDKKADGNDDNGCKESEFQEFGEEILTALLWHGTSVYLSVYYASMKWILAGLGNPGKEFEGTRHNVGREFLMQLEKKIPKNTSVVLPDTYMNNSGLAFKKLVTSKKQAEQLVVLQDELDLPLGSVKLSFGSGSGGHRGVDSIQKVLKTKDFVRIRIGISPATPSGRLKKPPAAKVVDFVLGKFKPAEHTKLKKAKKIVEDAIRLLVEEGRARAMTEINSRS